MGIRKKNGSLNKADNSSNAGSDVAAQFVSKINPDEIMDKYYKLKKIPAS